MWEAVSAAAKLENTDFSCLTGTLLENNWNDNVPPPPKKKKPFPRQLLSEVKGEKNAEYFIIHDHREDGVCIFIFNYL